MKHRTSAKLRTFVILVATLLSVVGLQSPVSATFVSSHCTTRGPAGGDYVDVCVRINLTYANGHHWVWGYGALDARGAHAALDHLYITALHIRVYAPVDGPEIGRITSPAKDGYDYINETTPYGYQVVCGYGYKAVMSYTIRFWEGTTVSGSNFYTPTGTARWSYC